LTVLVVTGTGTGVGKTIATAALTSAARHAGVDVAVCKPVQTGTDAGDDDLAEVTRLTGLTKVVGLARYPQPLAPLAAAEQAGVRATLLPSWAGHDAKIMTTIVPTGMIFVPSLKGISHSPLEATRWEDIDEGLKLLDQALRNLAA